MYYGLNINRYAECNLRPGKHQMGGIYENVRSLIQPDRKKPKVTMSSYKGKKKKK
jgi:hypothetical protein